MVISKDLLSSFWHKWQQGQQWEKSEAVCILFWFCSQHEEECSMYSIHKNSTKASS